MDLLNKTARKQLDKYLDPDLRALLGDVTTESSWGRRHHKLSKLIEDFSLVRFVPLNIEDEESVQDLLLQIDNVIQYGEDADVKIRDFDPPDPEETEADALYDKAEYTL